MSRSQQRWGGMAALRAMWRLLVMIALICGNLLTSASAEEWAVPEVDALPMDAFGRTVGVGRDLIVNTAATIGPEASDPAKRFSGNGLECQSCHLDAGTKKFGLPLAGVWGLFPQFISRENEVRTLEDRINGCMERSMNGRMLPPDGPEMKAMLTYIRFISAGFPTGRGAEGRGRRRSRCRPRRAIRNTVRRCSRKPARCAIRRTGRGSAGDRKMRRKDIATNSRHCGDRTAITTARAWHDRSRRLTLFAPTCRSAPITHTLYLARRMRSTLLFLSIVTRGCTGSATSEIFPTARSSPPTRPIRRSSARSRHCSI